MGRSNARGRSMSLLSRTDRGRDSTIGQAARIFVLSLALGATTQASAGPPSEPAQLARATCFFNEIHHPQAGKIAKATVFIAAAAPDGTLASEGTGFIVSDTADGGTQGSRIVVFGRSGVPFSTARVPHIPPDFLAIIGRGTPAHVAHRFRRSLSKPLASIAGSTNFKPL